MSTNKFYQFSIRLLLFIVLPALALSCKRNDNSSKTEKIQKLYSSKNINMELFELELNQIILNQVNGSQVIADSFEENKEKILSLTPKNNFFILYRYSEYMCGSCIQEDLNLFYEFINEHKNFDACVAIDYADNRENHIRFNYELEKFKYFRLDSTLLSLPINRSLGTESRYFAAIINENISYVFFPIRGNTKLTEMYFELIANLN